MDLAISSSRPWLRGLAKELLELADMQVQPGMKGMESVRNSDHDLRDLLTEQLRDSIYRFCQGAPAVAEVIAATIREKIPDTSPRLRSKRKARDDQSYRPTYPKKRRCDNDVYTVGSPMAPKSPILECETEDAMKSRAPIDTTNLGSTPQRQRRSGLTTLAKDQNGVESGNMNSSTTPTLFNEGQIESSPTPEGHFTKDQSFKDTIYKVVDNVSLLKKHPDDLPRTVHRKILQSLHTNPGPVIESQAVQWSDGKTWLEVLEKGSATNRRYIIFNMLEYMGASKWYDSQIEVAMQTVKTKQNRPVDEKGAAMHVLCRITHEHGLLDRKLVANLFSRGKKVRLLVKELGLGVLFSPDIWKYIKRNELELDQLLHDFQADPRWLALFQILTPQVERLVQTGSTDPEALHGALEEHNLVSEEELQKLVGKYALEHESLPNGALNAAYTRLISRVSNQVFQKRSLNDRDTFIVNNCLKLPADIFYALRPGEWLDCWVIKVAMQIADRPTRVHFRESIPVNDTRRNGRMRSIKKPFEAWAKEMAELRRKAKGTTPLVFYSPIHHTNSHFTLLEIDDGEQVIRHYDSLAEQTTIKGTKKTRIATLVEDEFGHLGYQYIEMPTPQQSDDWSCGARVIWAFKKRCNGLDIGSWNTVEDSERLQLDIVNSLMACINSNAMQKYSRGRERGVRNNTSLSDVLSEGGSKPACAEMICID